MLGYVQQCVPVSECLGVLWNFSFVLFSLLVDDKKVLRKKCENPVKELKTLDKKYQNKPKAVTEKW